MPRLGIVTVYREPDYRKILNGITPIMIKITRIAPEIPVGNMAEAKAYYHEKLGFETVFEMRQGDYVIVERSVAIHLYTTSDECQPVSIHLFVEGIDELHEELRKRGATIIQAVEKKPWGTRDFRVTDPNGNILKFTG